MEFLPEAAGPHDPILVTTARRAGSVRRTTNIDTTRPDGLRADARVDGRARDVRTNPDGTAEVVGEARLAAVVSPQQKLLSMTTSPDLPGLQQLLGASVGSGFRARVNEVVRESADDANARRAHFSTCCSMTCPVPRWSRGTSCTAPACWTIRRSTPTPSSRHLDVHCRTSDGGTCAPVGRRTPP